MRILLSLSLVACAASTKPALPHAGSPAAGLAGGWSTAGVYVCIIDDGLGVSKKPHRAAELATAKSCTWSKDGTGVCPVDHDSPPTHGGDDLHFTWTLADNSLTLSRYTDLTHDPVTLQRDTAMDCSPHAVAPTR